MTDVNCIFYNSGSDFSHLMILLVLFEEEYLGVKKGNLYYFPHQTNNEIMYDFNRTNISNITVFAQTF